MKTTQQRLAACRKKAADFAAKNPTHAAASHWRYWRRSICNSDAELYRTKDGDAYCYSLNALDIISDDQHNCDRNACGYYADAFQNSVIYGAVARINCGARGVLFAPVTYATEWDSVTIYLSQAELVKGDRGYDYYGYTDDGQSSDEIRAALYYARQMAEREAEQAQEEDAKYQAEQQIEEMREEIGNTRRECLALIRDIKTAQRSGMASTGAICAALRNQVREMLGTIRSNRKRIEKLTDNYWGAVA